MASFKFNQADMDRQLLLKKQQEEAKKKADAIAAQKAQEEADVDKYVKSIRESGRFLGLDESGNVQADLMGDLRLLGMHTRGRSFNSGYGQSGELKYKDQIFKKLKEQEQAKQDLAQENLLKNVEKNYVGMDEQGNAVFKDDAGQLSSYGGKDWSKVTDAVKKLYGDRSYGTYVGNEQLKSLGADFQGIDQETGAAVFSKGGETFGIAKDDPAFKNLYNVAQEQGKGKTWLNPEYEKAFKEQQEQGTSFKGFSDDNKAIFQNRLGQYETLEDQDNPILKFAKYKMANEKFSPSQAPVSNVGQGQNLIGEQADQAKASKQFAGRMAFQPRQGGFSRFQKSQSPAQPQVDLGTPTPQQQLQQRRPATQSPVLQSDIPDQADPFTPQELPSPPSMQDQLMAMGKGYAQQKLGEAESQAKGMAKQKVQQMASPYQQKIAGQIQDITGFDPRTSLRGQVANLAGQQTGLGGAAFTDPKQYATKQAESYGKDILKQQLGDSTFGMAQGVADILKGDVTKNVADYGKKQAIQQGIGALSGYTGLDQGLLQTGASLLQGGNVLGNAQKLAEDQAKKQALSSAANYLGVDPNMISGALDVGKNLFSGSVNRDTAKGAGEAVARGTLAALTGGVVSPESAMMASELGSKGYDLSKKVLGNTAGSILGTPLKIGSASTKAAGEMLGAGIGGAGEHAANVYDAAKRGVGGLKMLASGDLAKGTSEIAKSLGNFAAKSLVKQPVAIAKSAIKSIGKALSSVLCFDANTEIRMKDGSIKKAKDIQVGDDLAIGGRVIGSGEALSTEMYYYGDVLVSGAHAVFENGKWLRVHDSKLSKKVDLGEHKVYPIACENHIIITKDNQIWSDLLEIDDTSSYTDEERINKLNTMKRKNKMLKVFLNANKKV